MLQYEFDESVVHWVGITWHAFERALNDELAPHGITYRQWQVLGWLAMEGELSQVELAERMRIEPPTLVGILDRMERAGWIARSSSSSDRRKKIISATAAARPVWAKVVESARRIRDQATMGLDSQEREQLKKSLARIRANLGAPGVQHLTKDSQHEHA